MASLATPYITPEQYLENEQTAEFRSEYYHGSIIPMTAGNLRHSLIGVNILGALRSHPLTEGCYLFGSDGRVQVTAAGLYTYPDVSMVCGPPAYGDDKKESLTNPVLIAEVLSPSTRDYDCGRKFYLYRALPSLREYLVVAQDAPHINHYTRQDDDTWLITEIKGLENILRLQSVRVEIPFSAIYSKVEFDAEWPLQ